MWFLLPLKKREEFLQKLPFAKKSEKSSPYTKKPTISPKFTIETGEVKSTSQKNAPENSSTLSKSRVGHNYDEFDPLVIDEEAVILSKKSIKTTPASSIPSSNDPVEKAQTVEFDVKEIDLTTVLKKQPATETKEAPHTPYAASIKTVDSPPKKIDNSREDTISREEYQKMRQEIDQLKEQFAELRNEFNKLKDLQSAQAPHNQAIFLAKQGISTAELVERCGISQGEAELIISLYRNSPR